MSTRSYSLWVVATLLGGTPFATAAQVKLCFRAEGRMHMASREIAGETATVATALAALIAGPTDAERAAGITSALPPGTRIEQIITAGDSITIEFSADLLSAGVDDLWLETIYQQIRWTLQPLDAGSQIRLKAGGVSLSDYLPAVPKPQPAKETGTPPVQLEAAAGSALAGRKISLSPGHGQRWNGTSWNYERPVYCAPLNNEDLHNLELAVYLNTYLAQDGATMKVYRCLNKNFGNYAPGKPWWTVSAGYWIQHLGYPCSVYASSSGECIQGGGASDSTDSLYSRPLASDYDNTDIYISVHTNGLAGDCTGASCPNGTATYYDAGTAHAPWGDVSRTLAQNVQTSLIDVIRTHYGDSSWGNDGALDADGAYAETRVPDRAAILIELAYHDTCDRDALALQDEFFRSATMWGVYKGVCDYFGATPTYDFYSDEYVSDTIPTDMLPGHSYDVSITFRNRGVLWSNVRQFRLGAVGDSDPFTAATRVSLLTDVGPNQTYTFAFTMTAPSSPGTYTTDWRMVRDGVAWFGDTLTRQIQVARTYARGDFDEDHDVDLEDFGHLQICYTDVGVPQTDPACLDARLDLDEDVDPSDFAIFQACLTGPGETADPYCGG